MKLGLFKAEELSNEQYHSQEGGFYSSSQLKVAKQDIELFHKKYITGELLDKISGTALDIGTAFHTAVLEPELFDKEIAVFPGKKRLGKVWDVFREANEGKVIITLANQVTVDSLVKITTENEIVKDLMSSGVPELSFGVVDFHGLKIKVRADWIDTKRGFIMDLKSTTGNTKDEHKMLPKISSSDYDLSAALYVDVVNHHFGKEVIDTFYWPFASKDFHNCTVYASTPAMLAVGRAKYMKAINLIKKYTKEDWVFLDEVIMAYPAQWEQDLWLKDSKKEKQRFDSNPKVTPIKEEDLL